MLWVRRKGSLFLLAVLLSSWDRLSAQAGAEGSIRGTIRAASTGTPLAGVRVFVEGTRLDATSAADGTYEIPRLASGAWTMRVFLAGYDDEAAVVTIPAVGGTVTRDFELTASDEEEIGVYAQRPKSGEKFVLGERAKGGGSIATKVGQDEIAKTGGGDVGSIARRQSGVVVQDNKAFIRGLGERYSQTLFNKSQIPSPEPDKRVVPLNLFPTDAVDSIVIAKSYSADLPGEFSGGSFQIFTKEIPEEDFFSLGASLEYVDGTTFRDYATYHGGNLDALGFDDGTRSIPEEVPQERIALGGITGGGLTAEEIQAVGRSFPNIWNREIVSGPLNYGAEMAFGKRIGPGAEEGGLFGVTGTFNFGTDYLTVTDEVYRLVKNLGTIEDPEPFVFSDFELDSSTTESSMTALLNAAYRPNAVQTIGLRNFFTHSATDLTRFQTGFEGQSGTPIRVTRLRYTEKNIFFTQGYGEHLLQGPEDMDGTFGGDLFLEWRGSYALSQLDTPDDRQVRYNFEPSLNDFRYTDVARSGSRDFYLLDENFYDAGLDLHIPFHPIVDPTEEEIAQGKLEPDQKIKIGAAFNFRDRDFDSRRFRYTLAGVPAGEQLVDVNGNPISVISSPEDLFRAENIHPGAFFLTETTRNTDSYDADWTILAGYAMTDFKLHESVRLNVGARVESSEQNVQTVALFGENPNAVHTTLENVDVLPGASLAWTFYEPERAVRGGGNEKTGEKMLLRAAASQTVTRPEFRELSEFEFTDVEGGFATVGNPELQPTSLINLDLSWDWFLGEADLISASLFYKTMEDPIEQITLTTGSSPLKTWTNADTAEIYGVELEAKKSLSFLRGLFDGDGGSASSGPEDGPAAGRPGKPEEPRISVLDELRLIMNFAYIQSEVQLKDEDAGVQTNPSRPLQGQPDYVINVGMLYESLREEGFMKGVSAGILANTFGERITAVGAFGVPDEIEQPRWSLDLFVAKTFGQGQLKLTAKNILDDEYEFRQGDITDRQFRVGFSVGISYSYKW